MRRRWLAVLPAAGALAAAYALLVEAPYAPPTRGLIPNGVHKLPRIVAHKSLGGGAPGDTLEAVRQLLTTDVEALEVDVRLTRDGIPVIFHDETLDGFTTGHGRAEDHTRTELAAVRLLVGGAPSPHPIPTLDDVLALVGRSKFVFLDTKDASIGDSGMAAALAAQLQKHGVHPNVIVESFNPVFLLRVRRTDPRVLVMLDFADDTTPTAEESPEQLAQIPWVLRQEPFRRALRRLIRPDFLGPRFSVAPGRLRQLAGHGYPLVAWTVDDVAQATRLFDQGVTAVMTNEPLRMREAARKLELTQ